MKSEIHPDNYQPVIFHDTSSGERFLISSTIETKETETFDGKEYPKVDVEISSASHPFYTGQEKVLDTAGRVEKFKQRQAKAQANTGSKKKDTTESKEAAKSSATEGSISVEKNEVEKEN